MSDVFSCERHVAVPHTIHQKERGVIHGMSFGFWSQQVSLVAKVL